MHKSLGLSIVFAGLIGLFILACSGYPRYPQEAATGATGAPKYIFLFLADGAGTPHMEITRQYAWEMHGERLVIIDKIIKEGFLGIMTTHAANSLSTDSAAAATALASGCKGNIGVLGVCADGSAPKTVAEIARERGFKIGLVTNAAVYDASPAAFVCHVPNRRDYSAILNRYLETEPDVLLGGGRAQFASRTKLGSRRKDDLDFEDLFQKKGYQTVLHKQELEQARPGKLLGLFSLEDMSFELDRDKKSEPSVFDMTRAAIRHLGHNNPSGFFAFIETENTDTASHLSDVASVIHDFRELDRAIGLAYEFYRKHPRETLIIVTSDHETGGLGFTTALKELGSVRGNPQAVGTVRDLQKIGSIQISLQKASRLLGRHPTSEDIDNMMREHFNEFSLAPDYRDAIMKRRPLSRTLYIDPVAHALGMMIANQTQAYWQTSTHTNHPVFVAALGIGADQFAGYFDNADFGTKLRRIVGGQAVPSTPRW